MASHSDWIRRLGESRFNYWFGYAANGAWVLWLVSRGLPFGPDPLSPGRFGVHAAAGLLLWSLLEYALHRFVYHEWPSALSHGHGLHHEAPRALIGVPWWLTSAVLLGVFAALGQLLPAGPLGVEMGTCWLGYMGYCLVHHATHHWPMRCGVLRAIKRRHQAHHAFPDRNWGVTTPLWDHAFGTFAAQHETWRPRARRGQAQRAS